MKGIFKMFCVIRNAFSFNKALLSTETQRLETMIKECNSIAIHVRRDDYLSEQYRTGFGDICTVNYYSKAIQYIKSKVDSPLFLSFLMILNGRKKILVLKTACLLILIGVKTVGRICI